MSLFVFTASIAGTIVTLAGGYMACLVYERSARRPNVRMYKSG